MRSLIISILIIFLIINGNLMSQKMKFTTLKIEDSPIISFRIQFRVGSMNDPKGKEGLNQLTARLIAEGGYGEVTYKEMLEKLYPIAGRIRVFPDKEVTTFVADIHKDNVEKFWSIFEQVLTNPRMDESDFVRLKDLQINFIKNTLRRENDENLGKYYLQTMIYENHPYGSIEAGKISSLKSITLNDVKDFYKKFYTQANLTVGVAGNFEQKFLVRIKRDLSKLPAGKPNVVKLPKTQKIENIEVNLIEKKTPSTAISFGYPIDITRSHKDFYALMVANSYLGEHRTFNGVLMNKMRGDRGLNYGDYSYIENFIQDGGSTFPIPNIPRRQQYFSVWIRPVVNANRHFALRMAIREVEKLVKEGIPEKDFEETRQFLINYSKLWVQTQSRRLGYLMDSEFYGTGYIIDEIAKRLPKLTKKDVDNAIKKYLNFQNIKVAMVTEGSEEFSKDLINNTVSPITYQHSNISQHILDEDRYIQKYPLKINQKKLRIVKAEEVFE